MKGFEQEDGFDDATTNRRANEERCDHDDHGDDDSGYQVVLMSLVTFGDDDASDDCDGICHTETVADVGDHGDGGSDEEGSKWQAS